MRRFDGKRYWLVGASEGLGRALAHALARKGAEVIVSARDAERLNALAAEIGERASAVTIDIADDESVEKAAKEVGRIDGLILLAGVYWPMSTRQWDAKQAVTMADVNFTGWVRVLGQVVPDMVARDEGHIVLTGSLSGFRGLPGTIGYGASKAGVMSLAETMYYDLQKTGVDVQLANPGYIRTRLTDKNDFTMPQIMEPEEAARYMLTHMETGGFKSSFPRAFATFLRFTQFLPDWIYYRIFSPS